ncbi:DUF3313 domain-containing protein [Pantoea rodasii]|uniref:DUF3313 domain-containing protein n=1 Tax=Pantoea rodasii TaxID=1076549 RepID=A0A2M9W7C4_9GAMM|nr:DUF3313 domain-containing protein [Pantoea rodasii]ORM65533.1 hypothetical protein HA45_06280 [Pantoea rodasii]PJZ03408.1 DUF3313 domain-containing protein [Pantoea rodasii]
MPSHLSCGRILLLTSVLALAACSSTSPVKYAGLASSPKMTANTADDSDRVPFRYAAPVDWSKYRAITLDPVEIYTGSDAQFNDLSPEDRQRLADYLHKKFSETLAEKFVMNTSAGTSPTLRLKLTLTGADTTPQVVGTFTKFDLAGGPYNIVQSVRGGRGLMSGYVNYAVEIKDAATDKLLLAYVTEQYPNAMNVGATFGSLSAAETGIDKGADQLLEKLR